MSQNLQSPGGVLTGARQTMLSWTRVIESREEIPTPYKSYFEQTFDSAQPFPRVLWTPALSRFPRRTTEKLVVDAGDAIHIFERSGNEIDASCYRYCDIFAVEMGVVLLASWLTIRGKTSQGGAGVSKIEFNTIGMRHFEDIVRKMRPVLRDVDEAQVAAEKDKFDPLEAASFKFMNYARASLLPGETVLQFLLQPEIRQPLWTVLGRSFYKTVCLTHLALLTDRELILIRNADKTHESQADRYGGVWQFIPLHRLDSVGLSEAGQGRLALSVRHQPGETIERLFEASHRAELEQLCARLQTLIWKP